LASTKRVAAAVGDRAAVAAQIHQARAHHQSEAGRLIQSFAAGSAEIATLCS
jgi:hypothetical protein